MKHSLLGIVLLALGGGALIAVPTSDSLYFGVSSTSFLEVTMGYAHTFPRTAGSASAISVHGAVSVPVLLAAESGRLDTWRLEIGLDAASAIADRFEVLGGLSLYYLAQEDVLGKFSVIGAQLKLTPALHWRSGSVGLPLKLTVPLATHIRHSDVVLDTFQEMIDENGDPIDAAPADGWYAPTGLSIHAGIGGRFDLGERIALSSELGLIWYPSKHTGILDSMMIGQLPFYLDVGCSLEM